MSLVEIKNLTHSFGDKKIFNDTGFQLFRGDKMGLTGRNGAGKSTLINIMTGNVIPDTGYIKWNPKITYGYLDQQAKIGSNISVMDFLKGAFANLYKAQDELNKANAKLAVCKDKKEMKRLFEIAGSRQNFLESNNFFAVKSEIEKVAAGLGITAFGLDTPVGRLSGGQRAKVKLAKLLLAQPDVLLLDEPTNFLDKEHIEWLAKFLIAFKGSFVLVSHDSGFLKRVVNCICDIEFFTISRYNGSYDDYQRIKQQRAEEYQRNYEHQQKEIAKLQDYINRNLVRASTTKMAQSRRKKLEKMDVLEKPTAVVKPTFQFQFCNVSKKMLLKVRKLEVGYTEPLLPKIDLMIKTGQKLAVTGFNGIGKSTFLKTIAGFLPAISGSYRYEKDVKIGYYEQENIWDDPNKTAFAEIKDKYPRMRDREVRSALAQCGLRPEQMLQKLGTLSGGEQAKVKLCKIILTPCNLLILDEPTNHLDASAIEQLKQAVMNFEGSVIFVSHSKDFCELADSTLDMEKLFDTL
jgi:ATPase subunit of ABC transporter with duplicated ATPase domains